MDNINEYLSAVDGLMLSDLIAILWFGIAWTMHVQFGKGILKHKRMLFYMVKLQRLEWMKQMLRHNNRITDMTAIGNLMRSIAFFASTSIFIALALGTMLTYKDAAAEVLAALPFTAELSAVMWDIKIGLMTLVFVYAFFKFTWSLRQYNFVCIFICALPMPDEIPEKHEEIASQGCDLMNNAGRHFTLGIRTYYFGVATFCWIINPWAFIFATTAVILTIYRQEFRSRAFAAFSNITTSNTLKHSKATKSSDPFADGK